MSKITPQEILDAGDSSDEMDEGFADLIALTQADYEPGEDDFEAQAPEAIAQILEEGDIELLDYEFKEGEISGGYQQGSKKYRFLLTKNNGDWTKEIIDADS